MPCQCIFHNLQSAKGKRKIRRARAPRVRGWPQKGPRTESRDWRRLRESADGEGTLGSGHYRNVNWDVVKRKPKSRLTAAAASGALLWRAARARPPRTPAAAAAAWSRENKVAQISASWLSIDFLQRQMMPQGGPGSGRPWPISRLGRAGRPYRAWF